MRVEIDCNRSDNVVSNHDSLQRTLRVDPGAAVVSITIYLTLSMHSIEIQDFIH